LIGGKGHKIMIGFHVWIVLIVCLLQFTPNEKSTTDTIIKKEQVYLY